MEYLCKNKDTEANMDTVCFADYNSAYAYDPLSVYAEDRVISRKWSHDDLISWHRDLRHEVKNLVRKMCITDAYDLDMFEELRDSLNVWGRIMTKEEKIEYAIRESATSLVRGQLDQGQAAINAAKNSIAWD
jgi:hypothetical protein